MTEEQSEIYAKRFGSVTDTDGAHVEFSVQIDRFHLRDMIRRALHNKSGRSILGPLQVNAIRLTEDQAQKLPALQAGMREVK